MISIFYKKYNPLSPPKSSIQDWHKSIQSMHVSLFMKPLGLTHNEIIIKHGYYIRKFNGFSIKILRLKIVDADRNFLKTVSVLPYFLLPRLKLSTNDLYVVLNSINYEIYTKIYEKVISLDEEAYHLLRVRYSTMTKLIGKMNYLSIFEMSFSTLLKIYQLLTTQASLISLNLSI